MVTLWNGFPCEEFEFEGYNAYIVSPKPGTEVGKLVLKTLYWGAFPDIEINLLKKGYHLAFVNRASRVPTKDDCDRRARFVKFVSEKHNLDGKCVLVGMSFGGAHAMRLAYYYPELVSCIYLDAPVLNYASFPGKVGDANAEKVWEQEFLAAYPGMKRYQLLNFDEHPMNAIDTIMAHKIPVLMVWGDQDATVLYKENGLLMEQAYEGTDLMKVVCVKYRGHHPHGKIGDNTELVEYILANS